jgi:hypothetical protein
MRCRYCSFFQESPTRFGKEGTERFCNHVQKVVSINDETCEDGFEAHYLFWCNNTNAWIDLPVCPNRQSRGMQECSRCKQKRDILEIRKLMGVKARLNGTAPKPIIKKKINETHEETENRLKKIQGETPRSNKIIVTAEQKPKMILHKKEPETKPKMILHKRVKEKEEKFKPLKKIIKK